MRSLYAAPALACLFLILTGCSDSAPDTRAADTKAIKDLETQWVADFKAKDADKIAAHYTDDGIMMSPGMPAASTVDARKAMWKGFIDMATSFEFHASSVEVAKSGDLATTRGAYTMTYTDPATKKLVDDHGSYVTVYKKQADGSWKAVSDINVSEVPPPAPPTANAAPARKKKR